jgi:hypothetical protein
MRASIKSSIISRLAGAVAALWLGAGSAWAGTGGGDQDTYLASLCNVLFLASCPSFSTATETVLEIAALATIPPDIARTVSSIPPTVAVNAVNPPAGEPSPPSPFPPLSNLVPLAFISGKGGALATNPGDQSANVFFYAATDGVLPTTAGGSVGTPPTALYLVYDLPPLTSAQTIAAKAKGLDLADICLPLTSLNTGTSLESSLPSLVRVLDSSGKAVVVVGSCSTGSGIQPSQPSQLGVTVTLTLQSSPNSAAQHVVIKVRVPLLLAHATDPVYFGDTGVFSTFRQPIFVNPECGSIPDCTQVPPGATVVGMSPAAAHFTANIASTTGIVSVPAVDAYLAISIDGETLVSQLLPPPSPQ